MAKAKKTGGKVTKKAGSSKQGKKKKLTRPATSKRAGRKSAMKSRTVSTRKSGSKAAKVARGAKKLPQTLRTVKKKPTEKSAKKKAAKKKPAAPRGYPVTEDSAARTAAAPPVPETPTPVTVPGAWPFPLGNRP
jgi:hypothetical protein